MDLAYSKLWLYVVLVARVLKCKVERFLLLRIAVGAFYGSMIVWRLWHLAVGVALWWIVLAYVHVLRHCVLWGPWQLSSFVAYVSKCKPLCF